MRKETLWVGSLAKVDTIIHIADVHIRNLKRHEEYRSVFQKVYDVCRKKVEENKKLVAYDDELYTADEVRNQNMEDAFGI